MSDLSNTVSVETHGYNILYSKRPEFLIPDYDEALGVLAIDDTLAFPVDVDITDVFIYVDIEHQYPGDLVVGIRSLQGRVL